VQKQGAKRVQLVAKDDKWQLIAVFAGSMSGDFLPLQLMYKGKKKNSISINFLPLGT